MISRCGLYSICQRYNFESNLQQTYKPDDHGGHCIRYVKDTILKAIYNIFRCGENEQQTVFDMSKIQF